MDNSEESPQNSEKINVKEDHKNEEEALDPDEDGSGRVIN